MLLLCENDLDLLVGLGPHRIGVSHLASVLGPRLGRVVLVDNTFVPDAATRTVNTSLIPAGIYYVQISGKEFVRMERVVK